MSISRLYGECLLIVEVEGGNQGCGVLSTDAGNNLLIAFCRKFAIISKIYI